MAPPSGLSRTLCCNIEMSELPSPQDRVSCDWVDVTCPVNWPGRRVVESIVELEAQSAEKAKGSLDRLLGVRARLIRASSSEINSRLREELLGMIDQGE